MKGTLTAKAYGSLTPEERFRLVLAATGRGDEAEADRLAAAGGRITLSLPEHGPHLQAFLELGTLLFIDLLELAASYQQAFAACDSYAQHLAACGGPEVWDDDAKDGGDQERGDDDQGSESAVEPSVSGQEEDELAVADRLQQAALALGFQLRTKAEGWRLFCERWTVPPFPLLGMLPGFERVQRALALAEQAAFVPQGMARWMNRHRPAGAPEVNAAMMMTPGKIAAELEEAFGQLVAHQSGEGFPA
jgi:hypothetical protein